MNLLLKEIRHNPLLWLLAFVPVVLVAHKLKPEAHTLLFVLSVFAIVPVAALLSHATDPWRPRRAIRSVAYSTPRSET
jgi:Ca2+:H+ antiporter